MAEHTETRMTQIGICVIRVIRGYIYSRYCVTRKMPHSPLSNWKDDCVR
jgi:hypothetical protein